MLPLQVAVALLTFIAASILALSRGSAAIVSHHIVFAIGIPFKEQSDWYAASLSRLVSWVTVGLGHGIGWYLAVFAASVFLAQTLLLFIRRTEKSGSVTTS